ncbi:phosphatidylserine decarboxylase [Butyrivibrio sp. LC3010]|uniref:phosphatidylserine decarboxylase n=1 Tax=Butyrivibrio sp. LC3010 TaxID=1280680 RepID=UPI00040FA32C|nr:phosphatidylserine decarboxylase [Butyrivibrio sp. LC3010]
MNTLELLYKTTVGRIILKPLTMKPVSDLAGRILDLKISKMLIGPFAKRNNIKMEDYVLDDIHSFNDFFCRRIKDGLRPVCEDADKVIAPCDGYLKVCRISGGTVLNVKQSKFTVRSLLRDRKLAESFDGGYCLVYRLCVDHYHRYVYFTDGQKYKDRKIKGFYHTVRPVALSELPVFTENSRQYSVIDNDKLGRCIQMEVGAMLVGRIANDNPAAAVVKRGEEKGHFEYGGSTIIVLIPKDKIKLNSGIEQRSRRGIEFPVKMGEAVAEIL